MTTPHIAAGTVRVDAGGWRGPVRRIWTSLGYDEINWTHTPAGKRALGVIGAFAERPYYVRSHYIFNSGIGWSLPHWGAGNVYHEDATGRPFYDFAIADQVYDAVVAAGHRPLVELAFTPRALVPADAEARFRFEPSPTQWSPYEAGLWSFPPRDYDKWAGLVQALVAHCVARYGAPHVRGWLWELWNEPDISYWRGTPDEFYALYDVTAAAVKSALPDAAVGGPATTGDLGPGKATSSSADSWRIARTAPRRSTSSPSTRRGRASPRGGCTARSAARRPSGNPPRASRCCGRCGRRSRSWRTSRVSATCRASSMSATPRCRRTGASTTTRTSRTGTPNTTRSSSAS